MNKIKFTLRLSLALILIIALIYIVNPERLIPVISEAQWWYLLPMYLCIWNSQWIDAIVMKFLLGRMDSKTTVKRAFLASQLSSFYALLLPGDIASSGAKWAALSADTGRKSHTLYAMIYNKVCWTLIPLIYGVIAILIFNPLNNHTLPILIISLTIAIAFMAMVLGFPKSNRNIRRTLLSFTPVLPKRIQAKWKRLSKSLTILSSLKPVDHIKAYGLVATSSMLWIAALGFALKAAGISVNLFVIPWLYGVLSISKILPLTAGNVGIRESILILLLKPLGVAEPQALLAGLILFTCTISMALVGLIYQISLMAGWARWKKVSAETTSD